MKKGDNNLRTGFTIIEVALVLAIAGLIFLMVFVALPGLRASQRDAERRENVAMLLEKVKEYQTNNRGALPSGGSSARQGGASTSTRSTWQDFYNEYLGDNFMDPGGTNYRLKIVDCGSAKDMDCKNNFNSNATFPNNYEILVVKQATCSGERAKGTSNPRKIAVMYKLEGAGVYCSNT